MCPGRAPFWVARTGMAGSGECGQRTQPLPTVRRILGHALRAGDDLLVDRALKFTDYEAENAEPLVTASPLTSRLREKLGAQKLARPVGVMQITLGSLIAAKPVAPRVSAVGSFGVAGMMLGTLSFLVTTPEAWAEGRGDTPAVCAGRETIEGHRAPRRRPPDGCRVAANCSRRRSVAERSATVIRGMVGRSMRQDRHRRGQRHTHGRR